MDRNHRRVGEKTTPRGSRKTTVAGLPRPRTPAPPDASSSPPFPASVTSFRATLCRMPSHRLRPGQSCFVDSVWRDRAGTELALESAPMAPSQRSPTRGRRGRTRCRAAWRPSAIRRDHTADRPRGRGTAGHDIPAGHRLHLEATQPGQCPASCLRRTNRSRPDQEYFERSDTM
jgi:hypothetical protein